MANQGIYTDTNWIHGIQFNSPDGTALALQGNYACDVIRRGDSTVPLFTFTHADGTIDQSQKSVGKLQFIATPAQHQPAVPAGHYRLHLRRIDSASLWAAEGEMLVGKPGDMETYMRFASATDGSTAESFGVALGGPPGTTSWNALQDKPSTFPPSVHSHIIGDVTGLQSALDGKANSVHSHALATNVAPGFMDSVDKQLFDKSIEFDTRADALAHVFPASPSNFRVRRYDSANNITIDTLFGNPVTVNPSAQDQIAKTIGATTFYYTPQDAYIRPENHGCNFTGTSDDAAGLAKCMLEQRRTGKTIGAGDRTRIYGISAQFLSLLTTGQNVDIRGEGATIKFIGSSDTYRGFYWEIDPAVTGAFNFYMSGLRFDANSKVNHMLAIWNQSSTTQLGKVVLKDLEFASTTSVNIGSAAMVSVNGAFEYVHLENIKTGVFTKKLGTVTDLSSIYVGRGTTVGALENIIENCDIGGVSHADTTLFADTDGIKLFGQAANTSRERFYVKGGVIRNCSGRFVKIQAIDATVSGLAVKTTNNTFFTSHNGDGIVGNIFNAVDFQYGTGTCTDLDCDFVSGTGLTHVISATTRAYGKPLGLLVDGVRVKNAGTNNTDNVIFRFTEASAVAGFIDVNRVFMPDTNVNRIVNFASNFSGAAPPNQQERLVAHDVHVKQALSHGIGMDSRTGGAQTFVYATGGLTQGGAAVPLSANLGGTSTASPTLTRPNTGFT
jgi:hypothetical protein